VGGLVLGGVAEGRQSALIERRVAAMGTSLVLEVVAEDRAKALAASELALCAIEDTEARLSTWRADSEVSRLNRTAPGVEFAPSQELCEDLERALHWRNQTGGAFSPTVLPLVRAWGLENGGARPEARPLERARAASSRGAIAFSLPAAIVRRDRAAGLATGGFGKGVALDRAAAALESQGVQRAFFNFGGQTLLFGAVAGTTIALADPDQRRRPVLSLSLRSGSCATSGNSEQELAVDGAALSHLLDPRSGAPAADFGSLTVCAASATDADCLSTALFVLGPEAALKFAHQRPGIDVVAILRGPSEVRVRATSGLRGRLTVLLAGLTIEWYQPSFSIPSTQVGS
jgi:thiamine biosynthesis lipoprotein